MLTHAIILITTLWGKYCGIIIAVTLSTDKEPETESLSNLLKVK